MMILRSVPKLSTPFIGGGRAGGAWSLARSPCAPPSRKALVRARPRALRRNSEPTVTQPCAPQRTAASTKPRSIGQRPQRPRTNRGATHEAAGKRASVLECARPSGAVVQDGYCQPADEWLLPRRGSGDRLTARAKMRPGRRTMVALVGKRGRVPKRWRATALPRRWRD